jgi:putative peptidoglycan lipid II flippase
MTAIQGVAFATGVNFLCRLLNLGRHALITAYFGLSTGLDSFFAASAVVAILVTSLGDIFDSAGIPALVRTRERKGPEAFDELTGAVFMLALRLSAILTLLTLLAAPVAHLLFPGLSPEAKGAVRDNVLLLGFYAAAYLPYHCIGSFFRSVRRYHNYYIAELLVMLVAIIVVMIGKQSVLVVPISLSVGYLVGLAAMVGAAWNSFRLRTLEQPNEIGLVKATIRKMIPFYLGGYAMLLVEKYFASFLPAGGISALSYGFILASAIPAMMNIENVFVTPLSEETDRGQMLTTILCGVWLVALPAVVFTWVYAHDIVGGLFARGAFSAADGAQTVEALRGYSIAIPAYYVTPVCLRTLQILGALRWAVPATLATLAVNGGLGALFVFGLGRGTGGVALAVAIANSFFSIVALLVVRSAGVRIDGRRIFHLAPGSLVAVLVALLAAWWIPELESSLVTVGLKVLGFGAAYSLVCLVWPNAEFLRIRSLIAESFSR